MTTSSAERIAGYCIRYGIKIPDEITIASMSALMDSLNEVYYNNDYDDYEESESETKWSQLTKAMGFVDTVRDELTVELFMND